MASVRTPIMRELPGTSAHDQGSISRGNFLDPGDPVEPAHARPLPLLLPRDGRSEPPGRGASGSSTPENPLTARVAVNRFWAQLFGRGPRRDQEDFGTQGQPPSHPELLDWLAVRVPRRRLVDEGALPADRDLGDLSPVVAGRRPSCARRTRATGCWPAARGSGSRPR